MIPYMWGRQRFSLMRMFINGIPSIRSYWFLFCDVLFCDCPKLLVLVLKILEKKIVAHSSILAWKSPWTEEAGGPQSMGSQRVSHD